MDGNCLFNSISLAVFSTLKFAAFLRHLTVEYVIKHWDKFKGTVFVKGEQIYDPSLYSALMSPSGVFADETEVYSLAHILRLLIVIHTEKNIFKYKGDGANFVVYLKYSSNFETGHYEPFEVIPSSRFISHRDSSSPPMKRRVRFGTSVSPSKNAFVVSAASAVATHDAFHLSSVPASTCPIDSLIEAVRPVSNFSGQLETRDSCSKLVAVETIEPFVALPVTPVAAHDASPRPSLAATSLPFPRKPTSQDDPELLVPHLPSLAPFRFPPSASPILLPSVNNKSLDRHLYAIQQLFIKDNNNVTSASSLDNDYFNDSTLYDIGQLFCDDDNNVPLASSLDNNSFNDSLLYDIRHLLPENGDNNTSALLSENDDFYDSILRDIGQLFSEDDDNTSGLRLDNNDSALCKLYFEHDNKIPAKPTDASSESASAFQIRLYQRNGQDLSIQPLEFQNLVTIQSSNGSYDIMIPLRNQSFHNMALFPLHLMSHVKPPSVPPDLVSFSILCLVNETVFNFLEHFLSLPSANPPSPACLRSFEFSSAVCLCLHLRADNPQAKYDFTVLPTSLNSSESASTFEFCFPPRIGRDVPVLQGKVKLLDSFKFQFISRFLWSKSIALFSLSDKLVSHIVIHIGVPLETDRQLLTIYVTVQQSVNCGSIYERSLPFPFLNSKSMHLKNNSKKFHVPQLLSKQHDKHNDYFPFRFMPWFALIFVFISALILPLFGTLVQCDIIVKTINILSCYFYSQLHKTDFWNFHFYFMPLSYGRYGQLCNCRFKNTILLIFSTICMAQHKAINLNPFSSYKLRSFKFHSFTFFAFHRKISKPASKAETGTFAFFLMQLLGWVTLLLPAVSYVY